MNEGAGAVVLSEVSVSNSDNGLSILGRRVEFLNSYAFNNQSNGIKASGLTPESSIAMASVSHVFSHKNSNFGLRVTQTLGSEVASSDFNQNCDGGVSIEDSQVIFRDSAFTASLASAGLDVVGASSKVTLVNSFSRHKRIGIQVREAAGYLLIDQSRLGTFKEALLVASSSGLPSYRWTVVEDATWYQLYVNDESGNRFSRWMTADYLGCADGASECDFSPATY